MGAGAVQGRGWAAPLFTLHPSIFTLLFLFLPACEWLSERAPQESLPPVGTAPGHLAPALEGTAAGGDRFQLGRERARATVLVFYRGYHCGLCRERLRSLEAHRAAYQDAGARVVAVTLDPQEEVDRTREALGLGFPVVRVDTAVFAEWDILDGERELPLPASILLDNRRVIRYRHVGRNAADRAHDIEILAALQQLLAE